MDGNNVLYTPYAKKKLRLIEDLREEILLLPINNLTELRLQKHFTFLSLYYSMVLSGIHIYIGDVERLIEGDDTVKIDKDRANMILNYNKLLEYIHLYRMRSMSKLTSDYITSIHANLFVHTSFPGYIVGKYRGPGIHFDKRYVPAEANRVPDLLNEALAILYREDGIHPLLKAADFYVRFLKICPFVFGNG